MKRIWKKNMRVKSLTNIEKTLGDLMDASSKGAYVVPVFQRDFVWKKQQITSLADSILRGYPVGSLLIMPTSGGLNVITQALRASGAVVGDGSFYLMDGQQRLTSLFKIFVSDGERDQYFFDMLSILCEQFPDHDLEVLVPARFGTSKYPVDTECLCRAFKEEREGDTTRVNGRFIRCKIIIENKYPKIISEFIHSLGSVGVSDEALEDYQNHLTTLFSGIRMYQVPVVEISGDSSLDLVCRIFEKVNSSGTKLTALDLINAKTHSLRQGFDGGIASYISKRIQQWPQYRGRLKRVFDATFELDDKTGTFIALTPILKALHIASLISNQVPKPKVSNAKMLARDGEDWFADWDHFEEGLFSFVEWGERFGFFHSTTIGLFELLGGISAAMPDAFKKPEFKLAMLRYVFGLSITNTIFSHSEYNVALEFVEYGKTMVDAGVNYRERVRAPGKTREVLLSDIENARPNKLGFNAILSIMYRCHYQAKFATDMVGSLVEPDDGECDLHHLVAKASWIEKNRLHDTIANIVYLNKEANRYKIRDLSIPLTKQKLLEIMRGDAAQVDRLLEANLIPEVYRTDAEFLEERAELVLRYVVGFLSDK